VLDQYGSEHVEPFDINGLERVKQDCLFSRIQTTHGRDTQNTDTLF